MEEFLQALKLNPENDFAYIGLGDLYVQQSKWDDAITAYQNALARNDSGLTRTQLANAYILQGKPDAAVAELQKATAKDAKDIQLHLIAANMHKNTQPTR